ncbi:MAG TPA: hypothetical protein VGC42_01180 [Kofleriaceae bacterium]
MKAMTDISGRLPWVEVVLSGVVTLESLRPILICLGQLVTDAGTYMIRAEEVTRIELDAAELLLGFVDQAIQRGAVVRWAAASRGLVDAARGLTGRHRGVGALAS